MKILRLKTDPGSVGTSEEHEHLLGRDDENREAADGLIDGILVNAILVKPDQRLALMFELKPAASSLYGIPASKVGQIQSIIDQK